MKVLQCPDPLCKEWHCCQCKKVIFAIDTTTGTEMPPMIGDYMVCKECFDKYVSEGP